MDFRYKTKSYFITLVQVLTLLALTGPLRGAEELDKIVAVVNDDVVMKSELDERVDNVRQQLQQQGTPLPPITVLEKQVLDRLILQKLQIQEALKTGIRVDDETLNRTISNVAKDQQLTLAEFREIMDADPNYSYTRFREEMRDQILLARLQQRQVDNRVMVSEREIDNYLANQETMGESDLEYKLSHILVSIPDGATPGELADARDKVDMILEEIAAGKAFTELARNHSDGAQSLEGGDLGWRKTGQIPTLFADFVADMQVGDTSNLITSPSGYHVIKLVDTRTSEKHIVTQTQTRHILLKPDEIMTEQETLQRMRQLKLRIDGGDDFAEVARGNSQDMSAADGGDMGWTNPGELVPEYEAVMNSLDINEVSDPFQTQYGWHILQVMGRREHDSSDDLRRTRARESIRERKLTEARESWLRQMRNDAYVEYRIEF